ncbi:hypothetical protein [Citricoccus sp. NR2]|uniref:hypothetical protein n=1 Tax=Citricoccus sp. NR2 TaxID=3004095 RepID=UPI0022DDF6DE|nr:hypothetical protein [Citricoccus sp. NR2]WBL20459.1 hypothetical protein O1A05_07205 [Citricoccus sp. NR2]
MVDYEVFTREPRNTDVPEMEFDESSLNDLDEAYFRHVGRYASTMFYAALVNEQGGSSEEDSGQGLCFIALDGDDGTAATTCKAANELDAPTLSMTVQDSSHGDLDTFLVPDQLDIDLPDGWARTNTNVVIVPDPDASEQSVTGSLSGRGIWDDKDIILERGNTTE